MTVQHFDPTDIKITITSAAQAHFKKWLQSEEGAVGICLGTKKTGCSGYAYDTQLVFEEAASLIPVPGYDLPIFVEKGSAGLLNGLSIDYQVQSLGLKKIIYTNPNETARCGCGESFSVNRG